MNRMSDQDSFDRSQSRLTPDTTSASQQDRRSQPRVYLPLTFGPGNWDVICHNGKEYQEHVGNKRFKLCVENNLELYSNAGSRMARSGIITDIVNGIRGGGGGFIRFDQTEMRWYDVGDKIARDKAGQAIRDSLKLRMGERKQVKPSDTQQRVETSRFDEITSSGGAQEMIGNLGESARAIKILAGDGKIDLSPPSLPKDTLGSADSSPDTLYQLSKEVTSVDSSFVIKNGDPPSPEQWLALESIGNQRR